jgi:tetratricopeptide (TPR) repeat protein
VLKRSDASTAQKAIASNNLAVVLANQRKDLPEALELINNAGTGMGFTSDVLDTRGSVYLATGKFQDAAADFRDAVLVTYPSAMKLLHLAYAEDRVGDRSAASAALRRAKDAKLEAAALPKAEKAMYDQLAKDVGV